MAENTRPVVPNGPTMPGTLQGLGLDPLDLDDPEGKGAPKPKSSGGRRPYDELLDENKVQATRIEELKLALQPFAAMPDDGAKPDNEVLYTLARDSGMTNILCGDIRRARRALGMP